MGKTWYSNNCLHLKKMLFHLKNFCFHEQKGVFWFKRVLYQGPGQRESKLTVLCLLIIIILISYIIIYFIIIKLLTMENHPSQNGK
jgi:hypothetical protein